MGKSRKKSPRRARVRSAPAPRWASLRSLLLGTRTAIMGYLPIVAIFLGTRVALAEAYRIPSGSMEPTLLVGDQLFVNKLRLGPHVPFTSISLPGYARPARGDVVVFVSPPQHPAIRISPDDVTPMLVKRIAGVGGDTLLMRGGELMVNGVVVPARNTDFAMSREDAGRPHPLFAWQHTVAVHGSRFGAAVAHPSLHEWGPLVIPEGTFFMLGDNRDNSVDSRYYGLVPRGNLRGTPMFVYYSYDPTEGPEFLRALTEIRWRRLGTWIR